MSDQSDGGVCHFCKNESDDLRHCEDWRNGEEVPACPTCRQYFDLKLVGDSA